MGTHGKFDSIEECLEEAHESYVNFFSDVSRLQKISFEMESSYKAEVLLNKFRIKEHWIAFKMPENLHSST